MARIKDTGSSYQIIFLFYCSAFPWQNLYTANHTRTDHPNEISGIIYRGTCYLEDPRV